MSGIGSDCIRVPEPRKWWLSIILGMVWLANDGSGVAQDALKVSPVQFSMPGGVYSSNLEVSLSCPTPGATIRYTRGYQEPSTSSPIYTSPFVISNTTVIRAKAFQTAMLASDPVTAAYVVLDADLVSFNSKLPLVILNTYGRSVVPDMDPRVDATITVINTAESDGRATLSRPPDFHGRIGLEGRGQTSWGFPKKPYNVETRSETGVDTAVSLLGMPAESDWVLLNVYNDKTFMNDFLAHELFEKMGHYAVRRRYVEVFLNGTRPDESSDPSGKVSFNDYIGIYLLLEKIKIDKHRVDLARLGPQDITEPAITGGYIFKKDKDSPNDMGFNTTHGQYLKYHDPQGQELTQAQRSWLVNHINQFEATFYGANWRDPANGYARYIDPDSFVDNHWIVEFTKQIDGYRLSNYLHKDRGGRIKMEPIWDWNLSFGNADYLDGQYPSGWYWQLISTNEHIWLRRLIDEPGDPDFNQKIIDRWSVLRTNVLSATNVLARMDELALVLNESQARDFTRWPRLGSYIWPNPSGLASARTYAQVLSWVKNWVQQRYNWINGQFVQSPSFSRPGGPALLDEMISLTAPRGTIYYTLNGSDPRSRGGAVASGVAAYSQPIRLTSNARVFARARFNNEWSGPSIATFVLQTPSLAITELMYHPAPPPSDSTNLADDFQFIELLNVATNPLNLAGIKFTRGVDFAFAGGLLDPGQRILLVRNRDAFVSRYGSALNIGGVYTNSLAHNGERITLVGPLEEPILDFNYDPEWDLVTDGYGFSLVIKDESAPFGAWDEPGCWRRSGLLGGSPGTADIAANPGMVVVNEVLSNSGGPQVDAVEFHNPTTNDVDIGGWFLTDDPGSPSKFQIPAHTVVPALGFLVLDETHFNSSSASGFAFSAQGDEAFLFSARADGTLTGFSDGFSFGAASEGVSFGRFVNSIGKAQYPPQRSLTLGLPNSGPVIGPVVINEIHYYPAGATAEFIEIKNITSQPVQLYDPLHPTNSWWLEGAGFALPTNITMGPKELLVLASVDSTVFRTQYAVPSTVRILGPFLGNLQNNGELLQLQQPVAPVAKGNGSYEVPYVTVDAVRYDNHAPWPEAAAGLGSSLERIHSDEYGNDPANWRASFGIPSPGVENDGNRLPMVNSGPDQQLEASLYPVIVSLRGAATDDGLPQLPGRLFLAWSQVNGPGAVIFANSNKPVTSVSLPGQGIYVLRLSADDGELKAEDELAVVVSRPTQQQDLVSAGSEWKYLDNGSDAGTAWRALAFDDRTWKSGRAQLGYGDGDENTVVSYGPDSGNKHVTTYFRRAFSVTNAAGISELTLKVVRDDGIVVYLNGTEVFRDALSEGDIDYLTWASVISGDDESAIHERTVNPVLLREGPNILAVELHQCNATSTDLSFDLQLECRVSSVNEPPVVHAGQDQVLAWPAQVLLQGSFTDDGLPNPPGIVTSSWIKASGPGTVVFAPANQWITQAEFSAPGLYVLRLSVSDGLSSISDEVRVTLTNSIAEPPKIVSVEWMPDRPASIRIGFKGEPNHAYLLQGRDFLTDGMWQNLIEIPATSSNAGTIYVSNSIPTDISQRYYRILVSQ